MNSFTSAEHLPVCGFISWLFMKFHVQLEDWLGGPSRYQEYSWIQSPVADHHQAVSCPSSTKASLAACGHSSARFYTPGCRHLIYECCSNFCCNWFWSNLTIPQSFFPLIYFYSYCYRDQQSTSCARPGPGQAGPGQALVHTAWVDWSLPPWPGLESDQPREHTLHASL